MSYGTNAPSGLVPYSYIGATQWNKQETEFPNAWGSAYNASVYKGDLVSPTSGGLIQLYDVGSQTDPILGVFQGCSYIDAITEKLVFQPFWKANTTTFQSQKVTIYVLTDPNIVYNIQVKDTLSLEQTDLWSNCGVYNQGGNTSTGLSGFTLDISTVATTSTLPLKIIGLTPYTGGNSFGLENNNALVMINEHFFRIGTTGV